MEPSLSETRVMAAVRLGIVAFFVLAASPAPADEPGLERATLRLTLVDGETGEPLPKAWAELYGPGERSYKTAIRPERERDDRGRLVFHLDPGEYTAVAQQRPRRLDGLKYVAIGDEPTVTLEPGQTHEKTIELHPRPLTPEEISQRAPFVAFGTVTDDSGKPLPNVEVRVATGWGTLLGGGRTRTNAQGEYVLRFGTGVMMKDSESQLQAAQFRVNAPGLLEVSRSKPYGLMAYVMPEELPGYASPEEIFLKDESGRLDFVMTRAATLRARVVGADGADPNELSLKLESVEKRENGSRFLRGDDSDYRQAWEVLPNHAWRFVIGKRSKTRSVPFTLPAIGSYEAILRHRRLASNAPPLLELIEVRDQDGQAVAFDPGADPFARPPLPPEEQQRAEELVARIAEANTPWLRGVAKGFPPYAYRYVYHDEEPKEVTVRVDPWTPGWRNHGRHQGVTLWTALHALARDPDAVLYRSLDESEGRIAIAFTFREPGRWAIGAGVEGSWRGYFSRPMRDGVLVVDAARLTPRELRGDEVAIAFDEYLETTPAQYVPQRMRVEKEGVAWFDWRFAWREPGLWLYQQGERPGTENLATSIEGVTIGEATAGE